MVCAVLAIGTLPSVLFLAMGLGAGTLDGRGAMYFGAKLLAYVAEIGLLTWLTWWLVKGRRFRDPGTS